MFPRSRDGDRLAAAEQWQAQERAAARGRLVDLAQTTPDPVGPPTPEPPAEGRTVRVMRDGAVYLMLRVTHTEPPGMHPGWWTIHGAVKREDGLLGGSWWEPRSVYGQLQEDGSVRMLAKDGERIGADGIITDL